jgi:LytR cell envelope-related transcriptional attenuator
VSTPRQPDAPSSGSGGRRVPMLRAAIVIVAFVVATVLLLGVIHPSAAKSASSSGSAPNSAAGTTTSSSVGTTTTLTHTHQGGPTTTLATNKVSVLVANASGVSGAAAAVASELQPAGWDLAAPVNASAKVPVSTIYYLAGHQQAAIEIAQALKVPAALVQPYTTAAPISSIGASEVLVVVGPDLATLATSSTSTTAAATATTAARSSTSSTAHH